MQQFRRFDGFCRNLEHAGVKNFLRHCSNSAGILELPEVNMDMVRAGITIYGIYPSDEVARDIELHPAMELKSHVVYIKQIAKGTAISYGGTFVADHDMRIATIPVGYGDGYPRSLSSKGSVLIRGRRAPIVGRVCMDQFMVDVTDIPAELLDEVTLLGKDGEEEITIDELGTLPAVFHMNSSATSGNASHGFIWINASACVLIGPKLRRSDWSKARTGSDLRKSTNIRFHLS